MHTITKNEKIRKIKHEQGSPEWYTPSKYVEAARLVMGGIELDPASCVQANINIKAERYYTKEQNGLLQQWHCESLWLNPPGSEENGQSGQAIWQRQLITEYKAGRVKQAIMLIFNSSGTQTRWFQELLGNYPLCLTHHRIKFIPPDGVYPYAKKNNPVHGNAFCYFGKHEGRFTEVFSQFGKVIPAYLNKSLQERL